MMTSVKHMSRTITEKALLSTNCLVLIEHFFIFHQEKAFLNSTKCYFELIKIFSIEQLQKLTTFYGLCDDERSAFVGQFRVIDPA